MRNAKRSTTRLVAAVLEVPLLENVVQQRCRFTRRVLSLPLPQFLHRTAHGFLVGERWCPWPLSQSSPYFVEANSARHSVYTSPHDGTERNTSTHTRARTCTRTYIHTHIHIHIYIRVDTHARVARERRTEEVVVVVEEKEVVPDGGGCDGGDGRFAPNRKCPAPKPRSSIPFVPACSRTHVPRPEVAATHRPPPTYDNLLLPPRGPAPLEATATAEQHSPTATFQFLELSSVADVGLDLKSKNPFSYFYFYFPSRREESREREREESRWKGIVSGESAPGLEPEVGSSENIHHLPLSRSASPYRGTKHSHR